MCSTLGFTTQLESLYFSNWVHFRLKNILKGCQFYGSWPVFFTKKKVKFPFPLLFLSHFFFRLFSLLALKSYVRKLLSLPQACLEQSMTNGQGTLGSPDLVWWWFLPLSYKKEEKKMLKAKKVLERRRKKNKICQMELQSFLGFLLVAWKKAKLLQKNNKKNFPRYFHYTGVWLFLFARPVWWKKMQVFSSLAPEKQQKFVCNPSEGTQKINVLVRSLNILDHKLKVTFDTRMNLKPGGGETKTKITKEFVLLGWRRTRFSCSEDSKTGKMSNWM